MKKRNQINSKDKWDLTKFVEDDKKWYEMLDEVKILIKEIPKFKGKMNDKKMLSGFFDLSEKFFHKLSRLSMYASNNLNVELSNSKFVEMSNQLSGVESEISVLSSFYAPEMLSYDDNYINQLINDKDFKIHKFGLEVLLRSKQHVLSEKEEKILSASGNFAGEFYSIYNALCDINMKFDRVQNKNGKLLPLNQSNYSVYMSSSDRVLRKNAFKNLYKEYIGFEDTITNNYIAHLKSDWFYASVGKFDSTLSQILFPDNINPEVYNRLVLNVNNNISQLHKYYNLKSKLLNLKDFSYFDMYANNIKISKKISYENAIELLKKALLPLGDNYVSLIQKSVDEKWIDVYPNINKRSGAYQSDYYGETPIVLLNYENQIEDVFTLAHELGHAMHSFHANNAQPYTTAGYTIFLAEVASTVNEVLLLKYLYSNAKTKNEKIYYLNHYLHMFKSTVFRQVMFSEFEDYAHKLIEKNEPISKNVLNQYYANLNKKYQGKNVKHQKEIESEWLRIPHFYSSYYVYKYATGFVSAVCIASNIFNGKENALSDYIKYLSSGGSDYSVQTLKRAGVDLETDTPYEIAFKEMKWAVDQLKKII